MKLEIWSDPVCPWCYLGNARLQQAIAEAGTSPFEISWRPFQLDPDMPLDGRDADDHLNALFGDRARVDALHERIAEMGKQSGIRFDFAARKRIVNTRNAHRLAFWAGQQGRADAVMDRLFAGNFTLGQDISDPEVLADIAAQAGMERDQISALLAGDTDTAEVLQTEASGRAMGISGVPFYVLAGRYALSGAQDKSVWSQVISDIEAGKIA